jgi:hypothetical protein
MHAHSALAPSRPRARDRILDALRTHIEKPERAWLWTPADTIRFTPRVLPKVYGDGRALFALSTINQRPAYWVIRGCSTWSTGDALPGATGDDIREHIDDILTDLEEEFGNGRCGYSGGNLFQSRRDRIQLCRCEDCSARGRAKWPMVDGEGGCSWSRMSWPEAFPTSQGRLLLGATAARPRRG